MEQPTKVLIIDDTPSNLALLYDLLESRGCKVFVSQDGEHGKALAEEIVPDIILLDIMMPGGNGFGVCKALKEKPTTSDIPVIFLSALDDVDSKVKAFQLGAVDYIAKPLRQEEVLARIQLQVELKRNRRRILELEKTNTVLAMALTASHELTQPLTSLKGNLDLLEMVLAEQGILGTEGEGIADYIAKCRESIQNMETLLERYRSAGGAEDLDYGGGGRKFFFTPGGGGGGGLYKYKKKGKEQKTSEVLKG